MTGKNSEPDTLRDATMQFAYYLSGLVVLLGIQQALIWYASGLWFFTALNLLLNVVGFLYLLSVLIAGFELLSLAREDPTVRPLFGVLNIIAIGAMVYLAWLAWTWDASAWVMNSGVFSGTILKSQFQHRFSLIYGLVFKALIIGFIAIVAIATGHDTIGILSEWKRGESQTR